ncbi:MAG TPA: hypothetical protein VJR48_14285, partial [Ktedonobacterales bacterium]|nr:hypothetical protein [Ktedonobacterales bacterium]
MIAQTPTTSHHIRRADIASWRPRFLRAADDRASSISVHLAIGRPKLRLCPVLWAAKHPAEQLPPHIHPVPQQVHA